MRWQDIDLQKKLWTLPGDPDGAWPGTKNGQTHQVALSPQAVALLGELDPKSEGQVFPGKRGAVMSIPVTKTVWQGLGIPRFRPHDLRATAATAIRTMGFHLEDLSLVLNHAGPGNPTTKGYDRGLHLDQKRRCLEAWAAHLDAAIAGRVLPSQVVDIRAARPA